MMVKISKIAGHKGSDAFFSPGFWAKGLMRLNPEVGSQLQIDNIWACDEKEEDIDEKIYTPVVTLVVPNRKGFLIVAENELWVVNFMFRKNESQNS